MAPHTKHVLKLVAGWFFVFLGIIGLVLPILQGFLFLAIGLTILSGESARVRLWRMRLRARFPAAFAKLDQFEGAGRDWWERRKAWWRRGKV